MKKTVELLFLGSLALATPALSAPINLVTNGDFTAGNTGFSSSYTYAAVSNTAESQYTVRTNPSPWNPFFISAGDHTSGTGNMFVGNGSPTAGSLVWGSLAPISVLANTDYFFEAWAMNVCCTSNYTGPNSPAILEFAVVGDQSTASLGTIPTALNPGTWQFLSTTWNSGNNTSVSLRIINQNTAVGGNDFALDDIHFSTESSVSVPEPASLFLSGLGLAALVMSRRFNNTRQSRKS